MSEDLEKNIDALRKDLKEAKEGLEDRVLSLENKDLERTTTQKIFDKWAPRFTKLIGISSLTILAAVAFLYTKASQTNSSFQVMKTQMEAYDKEFATRSSTLLSGIEKREVSALKVLDKKANDFKLLEVPVGFVVPYAGPLLRTDIVEGDGSNLHNDVDNFLESLEGQGWLPCFGQAVSSKKWPKLYRVVGQTYGTGTLQPFQTREEGVDYDFNLPDLRDRFFRGAIGYHMINDQKVITLGGEDTWKRKDPRGRPKDDFDGPKVGSLQNYATANPGNFKITEGAHRNTVPVKNDTIRQGEKKEKTPVTAFTSVGTQMLQTENDGDHTHTISGGNSETRPVNIAVYFLIKAK